ncbi:MAG: hypothetical protein BWK80_50940 [Desulfobacteraceae bacterium IS3]|nr:MAG: hypothetical protein BWK80_50940 [Desulfobacteraceae bacterium IS3]
MKKSKDNMDIYEASEFWDEHDFGEYDDIVEVREVDIGLKKKKYVGIDMGLYCVIKSKAKELHKAEDILINEWLSEKVA